MAGEVISMPSLTFADARALAGDREFVRLAPADVLLRDGAAPRSPELLDHMTTSLEAVGQLVPIIVNADRVVIDGVTRVLAIRDLGLPVVLALELTATDELDDIWVRILANSVRRDMTVLEAHELHKRAKVILAARGESNRLAAAPANLGVTEVPKFGTSVESLVGNAAKAAAEELPYSHETLRKVHVLETAALDERTPEVVRRTAQEGLEAIRKTNRVDPAFKRFEAVRSALPEARKARVDGYDDAMFQAELVGLLNRVEPLVDIDPARSAEIMVKFGLFAGYRPIVDTLRRWSEFYVAGGDREVAKREASP